MKDLMYALRRRWIIIFTLVLVFTLSGGFVGNSIPPVFEEKTDLFVNYMKSSEGSIVPTMGELEMNLRLIETYTTNNEK